MCISLFSVKTPPSHVFLCPKNENGVLGVYDLRIKRKKGENNNMPCNCCCLFFVAESFQPDIAQTRVVWVRGGRLLNDGGTGRTGLTGISVGSRRNIFLLADGGPEGRHFIPYQTRTRVRESEMIKGRKHFMENLCWVAGRWGWLDGFGFLGDMNCEWFYSCYTVYNVIFGNRSLSAISIYVSLYLYSKVQNIDRWKHKNKNKQNFHLVCRSLIFPVRSVFIKFP